MGRRRAVLKDCKEPLEGSVKVKVIDLDTKEEYCGICEALPVVGEQFCIDTEDENIARRFRRFPKATMVTKTHFYTDRKKVFKYENLQ